MLLVWLPRFFPATPDANGYDWVLVVFLGGIPLVNAFFDWLSIGVTRRLLRRGLEKGALTQLGFAALDFLIALALLLALLFCTIAYIEVLNGASLAGNLTRAFDIAPVLGALRANPGDPSLWWIYVTIFTTFVPSFLNLLAGTTALLRGFGGARWVFNRLPANGDVEKTHHWLLPGALALETFVSGALAFLIFLGVGTMLFMLFPFLGEAMHIVAEAALDLNIAAFVANLFGPPPMT